MWELWALCSYKIMLHAYLQHFLDDIHFWQFQQECKQVPPDSQQWPHQGRQRDDDPWPPTLLRAVDPLVSSKLETLLDSDFVVLSSSTSNMIVHDHEMSYYRYSTYHYYFHLLLNQLHHRHYLFQHHISLPQSTLFNKHT